MYVCMRVNTIASKQCIRLSSNLVCILQVAVRRTLLILMNIGCIVFYKSTRKSSYTLQPMELNSLKCSSNQMVHSIELKFGMDIIGHHSTYFIEFGKLRINSFLTGAQKIFLYVTAYGVKL